ncbi:hypothetical protein RFI_32700 [Reticulomyxa filosa]|uniref:Uncharacterized protein n=1 Tax=Reticulomyxa filosa TaxID=46433 RepID=X6LSR4_RETFI|nr:hypothetical protein RFI_32700 [Reticulomyxa filosa]|eukprot:ETO04694.1 hypothetical protein RFI_32700 [Reticulomyxa filosa]
MYSNLLKMLKKKEKRCLEPVVSSSSKNNLSYYNACSTKILYKSLQKKSVHGLFLKLSLFLSLFHYIKMTRQYLKAARLDDLASDADKFANELLVRHADMYDRFERVETCTWPLIIIRIAFPFTNSTSNSNYRCDFLHSKCIDDVKDTYQYHAKKSSYVDLKSTQRAIACKNSNFSILGTAGTLKTM